VLSADSASEWSCTVSPGIAFSRVGSPVIDRQPTWGDPDRTDRPPLWAILRGEANSRSDEVNLSGVRLWTWSSGSSPRPSARTAPDAETKRQRLHDWTCRLLLAAEEVPVDAPGIAPRRCLARNAFIGAWGALEGAVFVACAGQIAAGLFKAAAAPGSAAIAPGDRGGRSRGR
jgi:hypothetical protein